MTKIAWNKGLPKNKQPFYGRKHTKKHKIKMSKLKNNLGIKLTDNWKNKISKSLLGNKRNKGKYYDPSVIIRINQKSCQCKQSCPWHKGLCNFSHKEALEIDHIKPKGKFPHLKRELTNLQVLCANCHLRKTRLEKSNGNQ